MDEERKRAIRVFAGGFGLSEYGDPRAANIIRELLEALEQAEAELQRSLSLIEGWCEWYMRVVPVMQKAEADNARLRELVDALEWVMEYVTVEGIEHP